MALQVRNLLKVCINHFAYRTKSHGRHCNEFSFNRKSRFIGKLLAENATERKLWRKGLITHKVYGSSSLSPRRLEALNKLFLASITDGLTSSRWCDQLADLGLMVHRAELSLCGQSLKVMWSTSSSEGDDQIARILEECQGELRDNIVTKAVGGFVPHIIFIKDMQATRVRDIDYILSLPSVVRDLQTELPKDESLEDGQDDRDRCKIEISTNILGLKRQDVLNRVMVTAKRLRKAERRRMEEGDQIDEESEVTEDIPNRLSNIDVRKQKSAIAAFIKKQKVAEKKQFLCALEQMKLHNEYEDIYANSVRDELDEEYEEENDFDLTDPSEKHCMDANEIDSVNLRKIAGETAGGDMKNECFK